jgi:hypothetical protein
MKNYKSSLEKYIKSISSSSWAIVLLIFAITFAILTPLILMRRTFIVNPDNTDQFFAWYQKLAIDVHHGFIPLWNTDTFSGQSFAGDFQAAVMYPINIIWVWLFGSGNGISENSINFLLTTQFAIGASGAYLLIKEFGASKLSSVLAGLLYVFSGSVATRASSQTVIFIGLTLLPYPIYFLLRSHNREKDKLRNLIYAGIAFGIVVLSGHVDGIYFTLLAILLLEASFYFTKNLGKKNWLKGLINAAFRVFIVGIFALIIGLPQLFLSAQYLPNAYRWQLNGYTPSTEKISYPDFASVFNLNFSDLGNVLNPATSVIQDGVSIFIGLLPLVIIVIAPAFSLLRKRDKELTKATNYSKWLLVFGLLSMFGYLTWFAVLLYKLPFVYQIREPVRYAFLVQLGVVILFAFALDSVVNSVKIFKKHRIFIVLVAAFLAINSLYILGIHRLRPNRIGFSYHYALQYALVACALLVLTFFVKPNARKYSLSALLIIVFVANSLWFMPIRANSNWTTDRYKMPADLIAQLQKTAGQYRVDIEYGSIPVNSGLVYHFQTVGGYGATVYSPYYIMQHDNPYVTHLIQPVNESTKYSVPAGERLSTPMQLDILGVKYVVVNSLQLVAPGVLAYSNTTSNLYLSERPTALSKIFTILKSGSNKRSDYVSLPTITNHYDDRYQSFTVTTKNKHLVAISEIQYPGWKLTIDDMPTTWKPYVVGGVPILRSFVLPAGTHKVEFKYQPF